MGKAYILGGARSYIGVENGMYRHLPAEKLGASVLQNVVGMVSPAEIDLVIAGNAVGVGGNLARLMVLEAGLPQSVPAFTVDLQCGSGLESIAIAAAKIKSGQGDLIVAGGFESCSTAPRRSYHKNHPDYERYGGEQGWYQVAKFMPGEHVTNAMLEGAERTALSENITRQDLDFWVLQSHMLARKARDEGILDKVLLTVQEKCGRDEGIRDRISQKLLDRLPCILKNGQVLTAANTCLTHDGAAFVILCSERVVQKYSLAPKAEVVDVAEVGTNPAMSPKSAITAVEKLLYKNTLSEKDIGVFECNEAFAVIDVLFARKYPTAIERLNIFGGALAYGHPYGASGGIITLHALCALERTGTDTAVCSVAAAGGVGTAVLLRRV